MPRCGRQSVPWVNVHVLPEYACFNHSVHIARGVWCVECHGAIDQMDVVTHAKPLSMTFVRRRRRKFIRSPKELVTKLDWKHPGGVEGQLEQGNGFWDVLGSVPYC
jgi:hypothetical protein